MPLFRPLLKLSTERLDAAAYQPLTLALAPLASGIALDKLLPLAAPLWWLLAAAAWLAWLIAWTKRRRGVGALLLSLSLLSAGAAWRHARWNLFPEDELGLYAGIESAPVCLEVVAVTSPRRVPAPPYDPLRPVQTGERSRMAVEFVSLRDDIEWRPVSGAAEILVDGQALGIHAGDRLRVFAQFSVPTPPRNPGEFDFDAHARAMRRRCQIFAEFPACLTVIERAQGWTWRRLADRVRRAGDAWLWRVLPAERAGLASALLLSERQEMDRERTDAYFETGTIHLLSISGLHVAILASFLFLGLRWGFARRKTAIFAVALVTLAYAAIIEAESPAARAALLVLFTCAGLGFGYKVPPGNALAGTALVVLAMNPADLFRAGPQLSFLAVATLVSVGPWVAERPIQDPLKRLILATRPWYSKGARKFGLWLRQSTLLGLAVWLVTLPLTLNQFHIVSAAGLALTPLLAAPVSAALLSGFALLAVGWLIPPLGGLLAWICDRSLWAIDACVRLASETPGGHFWTPGPETWWMLGCYLLLAVWCVVPGLRPPRRWTLAILTGWCALGFAIAAARERGEPKIECDFISVGHGCSVLLRLPGGEQILYDAGQLGSPEGAARSISAYLWSRGISRLDAVILSHADLDHYNALPTLLERFSVGRVYVSPLMKLDEGAGVRALFEALDQAGVPVEEVWSGDKLATSGDLQLEILHPPEKGVLGSDNANSLVLAIRFQGRRILLPGDLEEPGMDDLLSELPLDCDLVMAPHHGSSRSNPPGFAAWSTPEVVVISGGHGGDREPVEAAYSASGAIVLDTALVGTIETTIQGGQLTVNLPLRSD